MWRAFTDTYPKIVIRIGRLSVIHGRLDVARIRVCLPDIAEHGSLLGTLSHIQRLEIKHWSRVAHSVAA